MTIDAKVILSSGVVTLKFPPSFWHTTIASIINGGKESSDGMRNHNGVLLLYSWKIYFRYSVWMGKINYPSLELRYKSSDCLLAILLAKQLSLEIKTIKTKCRQKNLVLIKLILMYQLQYCVKKLLNYLLTGSNICLPSLPHSFSISFSVWANKQIFYLLEDSKIISCYCQEICKF